MPKTRLISPGSIPNHKLLKNLQLQGNYISNDGGDEGITIQDDGGVSVTSATTTNDALDITTTALTTGSALVIDADDSLTSATTKTLVNIDYDKSGVTGSGITNETTGLVINMADTVTNHVNSFVGMIGLQIDIDSSNDDGFLQHRGINLNVAADGTGDASTVSGINMEVMDGGIDIKCKSSADSSDYFAIQTAAAGATTISTVDSDNGEEANLTFDIQGDTIFKGDIADGTSTEVFRLDSSASSLFIASGKKIEFADTGEYITSDGTDLTMASGADILLTPTGNVGIGVSDPDSALEVMSTGNILKLSYDDDDYLLFEQQNSGDSKLTSSGGMQVRMAAAKDFIIYENGQQRFGIVNSTSDTTIKLVPDSNDTGDSFKIIVTDAGATTISATDNAAADAHLTLDIDGHVEFDGCGVGFDKISYTDDTNVTVDFTTGNKAELDMAGGSISGTLSLKFPDTSGNFLLVVKQDGSTRTIAAFATLDSGDNAGDNDGAADGAIRWAGGSPPDLTDGSNKDDILTFYWDADLEVCYGVASLNFYTA